MKVDNSNFKKYKRHIRKQKKLVSSEAFERLGKSISHEISLLTQENTNEIWVSLLESILARSIEYSNLSLLYPKESSKKTINAVLRNLSRLSANLEERTDLYLYEPYIDSSIDKLNRLLDGLCSEFYIQDSLHWFCAEHYFELKDGKISAEPRINITKQLISLSECSALDGLNYDDSIKPIALSALKAIRELHLHIDVYAIQNRLGYDVEKSLCIMRYLAENEYIEPQLNDEFEDLGYGTRKILVNIPEIEQTIKEDEE